MKHVVLFTVLFSACTGWCAERFALSAACQMLRDGDVLERLSVSFVRPTGSGENCFWDFSSINDGDKTSRIEIVSANDTLFCVLSGQTMHKYKMLGEELHAIGYENRTTVFRDTASARVLAFPFGYGQSSTASYRYGGKYALDRELIEEGVIYSEADAAGRMVTPSLDTLDNVLRVHVETRSWQKLLKVYETLSDTVVRDSLIENRTDFYFWYAEGYRYPVLESRSSGYYIGGKLAGSLTRESYYFSPEDQLFLPFDDDNSRVREKRKEEKWKSQASGDGDSGTGGNDQAELIRDIAITGTSSDVSISCNLSESMELEVILTDMQGRIFGHIPRRTVPAGYYAETIDCSALYPGDYLLSFFANGIRVCDKIFNH